MAESNSDQSATLARGDESVTVEWGERGLEVSVSAVVERAGVVVRRVYSMTGQTVTEYLEAEQLTAAVPERIGREVVDARRRSQKLLDLGICTHVLSGYPGEWVSAERHLEAVDRVARLEATMRHVREVLDPDIVPARATPLVDEMTQALRRRISKAEQAETREPNEWQALIDLADEATANISASEELG